MASSGTALTTDQIRLVKRMTNNITMLYDGDNAGIKAALRGTDMILEEGMNVRIVILPDQEDPDSFVSKKGAEGFLDFVKSNRKDLILFKTTLFAKEAAGDPIRKSELIKDIITSISKVPDPIQRSVYCKELAGHFDMQEQIITVEVNKIRRKKTDATEKSDYTVEEKTVLEAEHQKQIAEPTTNTLEILERDILRLFLEYGNWEIFIDENTKMPVAKYLIEELEGIEISTASLQKLYALITENTRNNEILSENFYSAHEDPEISIMAIQLLSSKYSISENWEKKFKIFVPEKKHIFIRDIESSVIRLKQYLVFNQLKTIEDKLKAEQSKPEEEQNLEEILKLLNAHNAVMKQKKEFALASKTVIYRPNT
jgi:DNA primase